MRILITGGAGFIGSHVVDRLIDEGCDVVVLDGLLPEVHHDAPEHLNPRADYRFADITDATAIGDAVRGIDAVSHQASMVGLETSPLDAYEYVRNNDLGTATLLRALYESDFRGPVVLASSMAVYGEGAFTCPVHGRVRPRPRPRQRLENGLFEPDCPTCGNDLSPLPVTEDDAADPRSVYAATKLHQEHLCLSFGRAAGIPITALRYHNVYGPRMPRDTPYAGVAAIFRSRLEQGHPPLVFEDGGQKRDFIHVRDVARANSLALTKMSAGIFNVATGEPHSVWEMAEAISASFGRDVSPPEVTRDFRLGDVRHAFASPARAAAQLGFEAEVTFEEGMAAFASDPIRETSSAID